MFVFLIVIRYSFIVYRYANVHLILKLQKKNKKNLSKNDKNISFIALFRVKMYEETFFMQIELEKRGGIASGQKISRP